MKKVVIIGVGGKSTLSTRLGKHLRLPVYHLDQHFWLPNWVERDKSKHKKIHDGLIKNDKWIIDGNIGVNSGMLDERLKLSDTVIFLNYPFWRVVLPRWFRRIWRYRGTTRPDMAKGNPEKFDWQYFKYLKSYDRKNVLTKLKRYQKDKQVLVFTKPKQAREFLKNL